MPAEERAMMSSELRYLLKTNSNCEACTDQESLCVLLTDLRVVADELDLSFSRANFEAGTLSELPDRSTFCPCI
jgi:hypothetical protein